MDPKKVEECVKLVIKDASYQKGREIYKVNVETIKSSIVNCAHLFKGYENIDLSIMDAYILFDGAK
jgi:hypothetical protein